VVDVFRVHDIVSRNAFGPGSQFGEESVSKASTGLWIWAAYITLASPMLEKNTLAIYWCSGPPDRSKLAKKSSTLTMNHPTTTKDSKP